MAFLYFLYDILGHLMELSKMFQRIKGNILCFFDIDPIINSTIQKIQYEYLDIDNNGNQK